MLDLDNVELISKELLKIIPREFIAPGINTFRDLDPNKVKQIDLLWTELAKVNLSKDNFGGAYIICVSPHSSNRIHIDGGFRTTALNWPVFGCKNTKTIFYKPKSDQITPDRHQTEDMREYFLYREEDVDEVDHVLWNDQPVILKILEMHRVENPTNTQRITVSLRFHQELDLD